MNATRLARRSNPLDWRGRAGIKATIIHLLVASLAAAFVTALFDVDEPVARDFLQVSFAALFAGPAFIRRVHDLGRSGWSATPLFLMPMIGPVRTSIEDWGPSLAQKATWTWSLTPGTAILVLVALPILWASYKLLFAHGDAGPNRYGPDPRHFV